MSKGKKIIKALICFWRYFFLYFSSNIYINYVEKYKPKLLKKNKRGRMEIKYIR
jgi:hypothetical protein